LTQRRCHLLLYGDDIENIFVSVTPDFMRRTEHPLNLCGVGNNLPRQFGIGGTVRLMSGESQETMRQMWYDLAREGGTMTDAERIEVLKQLVAKWRARYHTARNERDALIAENKRLQERIDELDANLNYMADW